MANLQSLPDSARNLIRIEYAPDYGVLLWDEQDAPPLSDEHFTVYRITESAEMYQFNLFYTYMRVRFRDNFCGLPVDEVRFLWAVFNASLT